MDWYRIAQGTPFLPLGEEHGGYYWGCIYAAAKPVMLDDEIRIYYSGQKGKHSWQPQRTLLGYPAPGRLGGL